MAAEIGPNREVVSTYRRYRSLARHERWHARWRAPILALVASLIWLPSAEGKGLESVTACGEGDCREIERLAPAARVGFDMLSVAWNGNPVRPPDVASDWFRIDFGWLPVAQGGDAIEEIIVPSTLDRLAFRQRGRVHWVKLGESHEAAEYAELVEGLTPFSAESFPSGLRVEIPQAASDDGGAALPWLPLGAGVGLLVSLGALVLRRRAAGTPD